jgi:hypothetical protein
MQTLDRLERWIAGLSQRWFGKLAGGEQARTALEIRRDVLNHIRGRIKAKGRGEYVFPYNSIAIRVLAPPADRETFEAAFLEEGGLGQDVRAMLAEAQCEPRGLEVTVTVVEDEAAVQREPFQVDYRRVPAKARRAGRPAAKLIVTRGQANVAELIISADRINLGRMQEVVSQSGGLLRRNDLAFADTELSVAREHAYIRYDAESACYRLCDYLSGERGTRLFRGGRSIAVPRASIRGVQLRAGDEIHLGEARIRFELAEAAGAGAASSQVTK